MRSKRLVIALLISSATSATALQAGLCGSPLFDKGVATYNQKQFGNAAKIFGQVLAAEPRNVAAALYLANSYFQLGQRNNAVQYYNWIVVSYPNSREAGVAATCLKSLGVALGTTAAGTAKQSESSASTAAAVSTSGTSHSASSSGAFDLKSMIRVVRAQGDHPNCTADFIKIVSSAVTDCPKRVLEFVASKGCKICLTPTLIDRNPELRNTKPRGYEEGHTYKNTPAMFDGREVVVCQYAAKDDSDDWEPTDDPVGAVRHEFGHAIDKYLGYISYQEEFRHIYYLDLGKVEPAAKEELAYYIQPGTEEGGPSECFAQACCILYGGSTSKGRMLRDKTFNQSFPNVLKYVKEKLNSF